MNETLFAGIDVSKLKHAIALTLDGKKNFITRHI